MMITVNGSKEDAPSGTTVRTLLEGHDLGAAPCAVEVNERLVPRREHGAHELREGDVVEIVTLVGGG
jgi:thiamine biosynthesis protein ThiS